MHLRALNTKHLVRRRRAYASYLQQSRGELTLESLIRWAHQRTKRLGGSAKTLNKTLAMIRLEHRRAHNGEWLTERDAQDLKAVISELELLDLTASCRKRALRLQHLMQIYYKTNLSVLSSLCTITLLFVIYDGLFRTGEILRTHPNDPHLRWDNVVEDDVDDSITVHIGKTKTSRDASVSVVLDSSRHRPTGAQLLRQLKAALPSNPLGSESVFPGWTAPKWRRELKRLVTSINLPGEHYSGHSLRAGAATDLFNMGVPYHSIRERGRWKSDAFLLYFRDNHAVRRHTRSAVDRLALKLRDKGKDGGPAPNSDSKL